MVEGLQRKVKSLEKKLLLDNAQKRQEMTRHLALKAKVKGGGLMGMHDGAQDYSEDVSSFSFSLKS